MTHHGGVKAWDFGEFSGLPSTLFGALANPGQDKVFVVFEFKNTHKSLFIIGGDAYKSE